MPPPAAGSSARREELLDRSYRYALTHGLVDMSLRPLAEAIGSSPRVLLFLFGSKDELVRALLARARRDELRLLHAARNGADGRMDMAEGAARVWEWLSAPEHRNLLRLWVEAYARSLIEPEGPWADFAALTVRDWLAVLADLQPPGVRDSPAADTQRTLVLATLRGAMLDLLATGERDRTGGAVHLQLAALSSPPRTAGSHIST
jgi:AcrR family transcriptional regulator